MNKNELITCVSQQSGLTKMEALRLVDALLGAISVALEKKIEVRVAGFGTFLVRKRATTQVRNPRTRQKMIISARHVPKFRAGKALKQLIDSTP